MIAPKQLADFQKFLELNDLKSKVIVEDLAKLIREKEINDPRKLVRPGRVLQRDDAGWNNYGARMGEYYSYNEIVDWMKRIEAQNPHLVRVFSIGKTAEKREIYGIK
uniref:AAA family ATPase n=1 Tax=Steinernema glaseri TaxID=37863 RepID=A0A1I7Y388_9BILA